MKFKFGNFESKQKFVSGTGVRIAVQSTNLYMSGNVTYGQYRISELFVTTLSISATVAVNSDETGHPILSMNECSARIGPFNLQTDNGWRLIRWIHNKSISLLNGIVRIYLQSKICPSLKTPLDDLNTQLTTLNAKVSEFVEIDYSLRSAVISDTSIEMGLKGVFYNTQQRTEPRRLSPPAFSLASQNTKMFYIAVSAFTINSAFLVFHNTKVFNINITDDMVPSVSPIRLSTTTFGAFIPQISQTHPDLKLELKVKTVKRPIIKFEPNHVILPLLSTVTAYAVQSDNTPSPTQLFVLNLESIASVQVSVQEGDLALDLTLEKIKVSMNIETFKLTKIHFLFMTMHDIVFPIMKAHLAKGFPLPGLLGSYIGKDYVLIGTDIQFGENTSS